MDERIEAFLKDVVDLEGVDANTVHEGVRAYLAVYEDIWSATESLRGIRGTEQLSLGASYAASGWPKK